MKPEETFKMLNGIDEKYIEEADEDRKESAQEENNASAENAAEQAEKPTKKTKKQSIFTWASLAAAIAVIVIVGFVMPYVNKSKHDAALRVKAAEISKASIEFYATMPTIMNVTNGRVIMYDYAGIWVYDLNKEKLVGFCDLQDLDMTQIQGYPCVLVESTADGKYVRFYWIDEFTGDIDTSKPMYVYDTYKDEYTKVENFDDYDFSKLSEMKVSTTENLSNHSETFELEDGSYITYVLKIPDQNIGAATYDDIYLVSKKDGKTKEYHVFEGE